MQTISKVLELWRSKSVNYFKTTLKGLHILRKLLIYSGYVVQLRKTVCEVFDIRDVKVFTFKTFKGSDNSVYIPLHIVYMDAAFFIPML